MLFSSEGGSGASAVRSLRVSGLGLGLRGANFFWVRVRVHRSMLVGY